MAMLLHMSQFVVAGRRSLPPAMYVIKNNAPTACYTLPAASTEPTSRWIPLCSLMWMAASAGGELAKPSPTSPPQRRSWHISAKRKFRSPVRRSRNTGPDSWFWCFLLLAAVTLSRNDEFGGLGISSRMGCVYQIGANTPGGLWLFLLCVVSLD